MFLDEASRHNFFISLEQFSQFYGDFEEKQRVIKTVCLVCNPIGVIFDDVRDFRAI